MTSSVLLFLVAHAGNPIAYVEAKDEHSALARVKGLGHILDFDPSLPIKASVVAKEIEGLPVFRNAYFEMMGFTS